MNDKPQTLWSLESAIHAGIVTPAEARAAELPMPTMAKGAIIALDLGTKLGWASTVVGDIVASGYVDFSSKRYEGGGMRYLRFQQWLNSIDRPRVIYFEEVRRHIGTTAAHVYGGLLAVLSAWCEQQSIPYCGVSVGTIKRHATGKGNASKEDMLDAVLTLFPKRQSTSLTSDEADALCLLHYAMSQNSKPIEHL